MEAFSKHYWPVLIGYLWKSWNVLLMFVFIDCGSLEISELLSKTKVKACGMSWKCFDKRNYSYRTIAMVTQTN